MPEPSTPVPPIECPCDGCAQLQAEYGSDPILHTMYRKKLLIRGWASFRSPAEKAYQRAHAPWVRSMAARMAGKPFTGAKKQAENTDPSGGKPRKACPEPAPASGAP